MSSRWFLAACAVAALGCGDDSGGNDQTDAGSTGYTLEGLSCPENSDVTYEGFVAGFMDDYCTRCHSTEVTGAARMLAPEDHNFNTLEGVNKDIEHIAEQAAAGPDFVHELMPPSGDAPTRADREKLGEWLACQAKQGIGQSDEEHEHEHEHEHEE